jgi:ribosomal protein L10
MSKTIKDMIVREYKKRFTGVEGAVLVELRGMAGIDNTGLRLKMHAKQVRVTVVKNALARKAFEGTALEVLAPGLSGPTAVVYGGDSVVGIARDLVKMAKDQEALVLRVDQKGPGACHTGYRSCFFRSVSVSENREASLRTIYPSKEYDPAAVYKA